jgi:hypothetical protein
MDTSTIALISTICLILANVLINWAANRIRHKRKMLEELLNDE